MRKFSGAFAAVATVVSAVSITSVAGAATVAFETSTDMSLFNQRQTSSNSTTVTDAFTQNGTAGTNGGGGAVFTSNTFNLNNDTSAVYNSESYDFSTLSTPVGASIDFHTPSTLDTATATVAPVAAAGFSLDSGNGFGGTAANAFLYGRLSRTAANTYTVQVQTDGSTSSATTTTQSAAGTLTGLTASNWYRLTLNLTKTSTASNFTASVTLYDLGSLGTGTPTAVTDSSTGISSVTVANAVLYNDTSVFGGFRAVAGTNTDAFDNFTTVPEPMGLALLGVGGIVLRRRRSV